MLDDREIYPISHDADGYREISANELSREIWDIAEVRIIPDHPKPIHCGKTIQFRAYGVLNNPDKTIADAEITPIWECGTAGTIAAIFPGRTDHIEFIAGATPGNFSISARYVNKHCDIITQKVEVEIMAEKDKGDASKAAAVITPTLPRVKDEPPTQTTTTSSVITAERQVSLRETTYDERQKIQKVLAETTGARMKELASPIQNKDAWAGGGAYLFFAYGVTCIEKYFSSDTATFTDLKYGLLSMLAFFILAIVKNGLPAGPLSEWLKQSSRKTVDDVRKTITGG